MDNGLKQRTIGALVLIALAVIFLPSLFDDTRKQTLDTRTQIPSMPDIQPLEIKAPKSVAQIESAPDAKDFYKLETVEEETKSVTAKQAQPVLDDKGLPLAWVSNASA